MNPTTALMQQLDSNHYLHPFSDSQQLKKNGVRVMVKGEGIWLTDSEGNRILDGMSGLWCVNVGYGRSELIAAATQQLQQLSYYNSFFMTTNIPAVELAQTIVDWAGPGFSHVFYTNSGSEANDTNIRLIRRYFELLGQPQKKVIISRHNAYHGSTIGAASLGGMSSMHDGITIPIAGTAKINQPYWRDQQGEQTEAEFAWTAASWLEQKILEMGAENVAAFIGEPIQGAGGVIIPPEGYWQHIQNICKKYDVLLVCDEVITGFGRLGHPFGFQAYGITPDLVTFAKGVTSGYFPLGGVIVGHAIAQVMIEKAGEFAHGFTYSGHPVGAAVGLANLALLQQQAWIEKVRDAIGAYFAHAMTTLLEHPLVARVECKGLMGAVLLTSPHSGRLFDASEGERVGLLCRRHCFEQGLVMRAVGDRMIVAPPLCITHEEIDLLVAKAKAALDKTLADL